MICQTRNSYEGLEALLVISAENLASNFYASPGNGGAAFKTDFFQLANFHDFAVLYGELNFAMAQTANHTANDFDPLACSRFAIVNGWIGRWLCGRVGGV